MAATDFRRVLESLKLPVAIGDSAGRIEFANAAFAKLAGKDEAALAGKPLESLFDGEDAKRVRQNVVRVAEAKAASAICEARLPTGDEERWVQLVLQPLDAREQPAGVVAIVQDIGVQRETEQALYVLTARLLALAEASPIPTLIESAAGDVEMVNEAFLRLVGLEGAPQSYMGLPAEKMLAQAKTLDREALAREPIVVEGDESGAIWGPKAKSPGDAAAKGVAEGALIERIGEELSIALEGMSAIAHHARQMEFEAILVEHFQRIRRSTETAMAAIGDLVDFSNVSGSIVLRKAEFALRPALASLIGRLLPEAEDHDCRLRVKVDQDVSEVLVGDVERLDLVLKNLLLGAFTHLPGAEITLQITPEYVTDSGIQLSFSVVFSDAGISAPMTVASVGGGMGIAVAKFMVTAMGGRLEVAANTRIGEAIYGFAIEFPVRPAPPAPARPAYVAVEGMTVLVVAADPEQRLALASRLRAARMIPLEADNAAMAMALLERLHGEGNPVPLVLLSNRLAGHDGFLLAFRIAHHPKLSSTLLMMLATDGRPGDAIACRENGISAYMRYPINERQLNEAIAAVTGASAEALRAEATATLVTRHSLRESRKGASILLVDSDADSQILAAHILGRHDCSVVVAHDVGEALAALDQDTYDIVLVETALEGFGGDDAAKLLRARLTRDPAHTLIAATTVEHTPRFREAKRAIGFDATVGKPFERDALVALLEAARPRAEA